MNQPVLIRIYARWVSLSAMLQRWIVSIFGLSLLIVVTLTGCLTPDSGLKMVNRSIEPGGLQSSNANTTSPGSDSTTRSVRVNFQTSSTTGSFDENDVIALGTAGTPSAAGSGLKAKRLFDPASTTAAVPVSVGGPGSPGWPAWLSNIELGVSGSANTRAPQPGCARFSNITDESALCGTVPCGAPAGYFRVSDSDCPNVTSDPAGAGGAGDGVYLRVDFNRSGLAAGQNAMLVLEYTSTMQNAGAADPSKCFAGGKLSLGNALCADSVWQVFLKTGASATTVHPFLLLAPPSENITTSGNQSVGIRTKQIFIPLAANPGLSTIQVSRIWGNTCNVANSALCIGMVFYQMTLYRI